MVYRQVTLIFSLLVVFISQPILACSMAPGVPYPSPPTKIELYHEAKTAFMVKVLEVKRTAPKLDNLITEIKKKNTAINLERDKLINEIKRVQTKNKYNLETIEANSQLNRLKKTEKSLYGKFYDLEKKPFKHNLYHVYANKRNKVVDEIIANKSKILLLKNQLELIELKKKFVKTNINYLRKDINDLKSVLLVDEYHGPIEVKLEIIKVYKSDRTVGETFTLSDEDRRFSDSCGLGGNHDLMNFIYKVAKPDHIAVLFGKPNDSFYIKELGQKKTFYQLGLSGKQHSKESIHQLMLSYNSKQKQVAKTESIKTEKVKQQTELEIVSTAEELFDIGKRVLLVSLRERDGRYTQKYKASLFNDPVKILALSRDGKITQLIDFKEKMDK